MKPNTTERGLRLECLKIASAVAMQLKLSPDKVIPAAKAYYDFLNSSEELVERGDRAKPYDGRVFNSMGDRL